MRYLAFTATLVLASCHSGPYDWAPTEAALRRSLSPGLPLARAIEVLDSLGFAHGPPTSGDTVLVASKREPGSHQLVFSTLAVVLTLGPSQSIGSLDTQVWLTGP